MPNLRPVWDFLRGVSPDGGLDQRAAASLEHLRAAPLERRYSIDDFRAVMPAGMLIHGPGASLLLGQERGDRLARTSAVLACLRARLSAYLEAPLLVWEGESPTQRNVLPDHPAAALLASPNPFFTGRGVRWYVQWCKVVDGNAYVRKIRSRIGQPVELWPVSPARMTPVSDGRAFIRAYKYEYAPGKFDLVPPEDIIHFRTGLDDTDHRKGCSDLKALVREIASDEAATAFAEELLDNYAMPGLIITAGEPITREQALAAKQAVQESFGKGNRGMAAVLSGNGTAEAFGLSPKDLDLHALHRLPEERISAVLGVPAIVAGLGAGLDRATYANYKEAREAFIEQTILTEYATDEEVWTIGLLREFDSDPQHLFAHDISQMRALQDDKDALWARVTTAFEKGLLPQETALAELGYDPAEVMALVGPGQPSLQLVGGEPAGQVQGAEQQAATAIGAAITRYLEVKGSGSLDELPAVLQAIVEAALPGMETDLDRYFAGQERRVIRRVLDG